MCSIYELCSLDMGDTNPPSCDNQNVSREFLGGFTSDQSLNHVQLFATPWTAASQALLSFTISQSLLKLMSIGSVMPSNHRILCHPLLLLPSIFPSIRVFSKESVLCIRWPKYFSFTFSTSLSNEYSGLISFRKDCLDLLTVQGFSRVLQHHSSKASILQRSAFLIVQLSHPYMTTGKTIALTRQTFVGKVTSLLFIGISSGPRGRGSSFSLLYSVCSFFPWMLTFLKCPLVLLCAFTLCIHFHKLSCGLCADVSPCSSLSSSQTLLANCPLA